MRAGEGTVLRRRGLVGIGGSGGWGIKWLGISICCRGDFGGDATRGLRGGMGNPRSAAAAAAASCEREQTPGQKVVTLAFDPTAALAVAHTAESAATTPSEADAASCIARSRVHEVASALLGTRSATPSASFRPASF